MVFDRQIPNLKEACRMIDICLYLPGVVAVAPLRSVAAVNPHILLDLSKKKERSSEPDLVRVQGPLRNSRKTWAQPERHQRAKERKS